MTGPAEDWLDGDAYRMARPYAVTGGRSRASVALDLMSMIIATGTGAASHLQADHAEILSLCPAPVAEIAARYRQPVVITKILLGDLADCGAVRVSGPPERPPAADHHLLERLLDGLQRL